MKEAPATWAGVLEWGAAGDAQQASSAQALALVVGGPTPPPNSGVVTTLSGSGNAAFADGTGAAASFNSPSGVAVIPSSGLVVVADMYNHRLRLVDTTTGAVTTLAGSGSEAFADGTGASASFSRPAGVAVIPSSSFIVVADHNNHRIRLVDPISHAVTTLAGSGNQALADGTGTAASFNHPLGVAVVPLSGAIVVADMLNNCIRHVTQLGVVSTLAGSGNYAYADGTGAEASFRSPAVLAVISSSSVVVVVDAFNSRIRLVTPVGVVTTLAGSGSSASVDGTGVAASFNGPAGVAVIPSSGVIVVSDRLSNLIRLVTPSGVVTTLAGSGSRGFADGTGTAASFRNPLHAAVIPSTGAIVLADQENHRIRIVTLPAVLMTCDATWHHVALAYSPSASPHTLSAFLDGALAFQLAAAITLPARAASTLRVGWSGDLTANAGSLFAGSLAELRVYARALSTTEVAALSQPPLAAFANTAVTPSLPTAGATS